MKTCDCSNFQRIWKLKLNPTTAELADAYQHLDQCPVCGALELELESRFTLQDYSTPGNGVAYLDGLIAAERDNPAQVLRDLSNSRQRVLDKLRAHPAVKWNILKSFFMKRTQWSLPDYLANVSERAVASTRAAGRIPIFEVNAASPDSTGFAGIRNSGFIQDRQSGRLILKLSGFQPEFAGHQALFLMAPKQILLELCNIDYAHECEAQILVERQLRKIILKSDMEDKTMQKLRTNCNAVIGNLVDEETDVTLTIDFSGHSRHMAIHPDTWFILVVSHMPIT